MTEGGKLFGKIFVGSDEKKKKKKRGGGGKKLKFLFRFPEKRTVYEKGGQG